MRTWVLAALFSALGCVGDMPCEGSGCEEGVLTVAPVAARQQDESQHSTGITSCDAIAGACHGKKSDAADRCHLGSEGQWSEAECATESPACLAACQ